MEIVVVPLRTNLLSLLLSLLSILISTGNFGTFFLGV